ncbi:Polyprotein P3 [Nymphaea thermarum]|nr:Polyprotein P3 [Nymphaea thermarum]
MVDLGGLNFPLAYAHGSKIYSKFDLKSGFHQVMMDPDSIPLTAFWVPQGLFEWLVVEVDLSRGNQIIFRPKGITNHLTTFELCLQEWQDHPGPPSQQQKFHHLCNQVVQSINNTRASITGLGIDVSFEHINGKDNVLADSLSRIITLLVDSPPQEHPR